MIYNIKMIRRKKNTLIHSSELRKRFYGGSAIAEYADEILTTINSAVHDALENNFEEVVVDLPTVFNVMHMTPERSQKHIYNIY